MDPSLLNQFSWTGFLTLSIGLLALYFILQAAYRLSKRTSILGRWQGRVIDRIRQTLLIYEPIALFLLVGAFILINPTLHGILIAFLLLTGFSHLRNYISGRIILFETPNLRGKRLRTGGVEGIVAQAGRLGLQVETNEGLHSLYYAQIQANGYTLLAGEEIGGVFQLYIEGQGEEKTVKNPVHLLDQLATAPYVDWNHKPELLHTYTEREGVQVRIWVQEESHLYDLLSLIKEWGYQPSLTSK
ncbi:MAG: hypothetical protein HRU41_06955 [Saprospiraceae bacterium]|nr:hypothetical protein [Saprospiraceae bacterium]